ncbi:D-alanyl-D-alanine endopeptidase (penicillin-binding protein 7) [Tamilnaduibacter salinus]|uniref:D-alanyl-D-alanine endopeptidase (Penicillin-binding protein 7) n=1 Tax=Tamilnaduibacter salinus TaxID=1484056 RepID=A0A2U1CWJ7_9GAMM|nr:D-alanyl-D-alanine endopeptidase [Tamilnaduibacter salinus]PVY76336.1 D-alanyl-D-alanine endopeptidase (penicillin-binding protein 7) [Tamilnaduibacter salinus]
MCQRWIECLILLCAMANVHAAPDPEGLELASVNAAVAPLEGDTTWYSKHPERSVPIASITKLMTALVVLESGEPMNEWLEVYERHREAPNNAYSRIRIGSELQRRNMLRLALMSSENLAAYTLARHHPGGFEAFVAAMNEQARALGMDQSHFVEPTGLSPRNRASADDLVALVRAIWQHPELRELTATGYYTARFREPRYNLRYGNTNVLVHRGRWDVKLTKTGYLSEAGRCLVMVSMMQGEPVITVLLDSFGTRTPIGDAGRVRRWLKIGQGGAIADAARRYEKQRNREYQQVSRSDAAPES